MTISLGEEFYFPIASDNPVRYKPNHWQHPAGNSTMNINGIGIDVFQWRAAAESRESIKVDLINPVWEYISWNKNDIKFPEIIEISEVSNYRGTPMVYIKITPWRNIGNVVEVLVGGEIKIWVETTDYPVTFSHPHLLNGEKQTSNRATADVTEYLIICPSRFESIAESLADIHSIGVDMVGIEPLITEVVLTNEIPNNNTGMGLRNYIIDRINADSSNDLKFLLLFGDEIDIPPIFFDDDSSTFPSDDFYTTNNIFGEPPQLSTGRIPVSTTEDAIAIVEKIRKYILTPTTGMWRSKVALVADDIYDPLCSPKESESSHTVNSQELFDTLKTLLPILPYYGVGYGLHNCEHPTLTRDLIQTINNGIALVNYIGHGDPDTWAGEKILSKSRDLPLIHVNDNKLAIWVAGTCSFGDYYDKNSFMEDLLIKDDGAIAIIAATEDISSSINWTFIKHFFGLDYTGGIADYINNNNDLRLGELVLNIKTKNDYSFQTFGDPALPLPFPKITNIENKLVDDYPENVNLIVEETLSFNHSSQYSILIRENEKEYSFDYGTYTVPETYAQIDVVGDSACFRIPWDAGTCDGCMVIQVYKDSTGWDGKIETESNISLFYLDDNFEDKQGPTILLSQGTRDLTYGSAIFPNIDLTLYLEDESGINLMSTNDHGIRYKFEGEEEVRVPGDEFIYTSCSGGWVKLPVPLSEGAHQLSIEAWDGVNNDTDTIIYFDFLPPIVQGKLNISNVFPIPSPFSESTHFTMYISELPSLITITVYSLNGNKVRVIKDEANTHFFSIYWDGKNQYGQKIANGAYFYHIKAKTNDNLVFENIYKLAKIE